MSNRSASASAFPALSLDIPRCSQLIHTVWWMESLILYKRLLLKRYGDVMTSEGRGDLGSECLDLLNKLQDINPDRRQRYTNLGTSSHVPRDSKLT